MVGNVIRQLTDKNQNLKLKNDAFKWGHPELVSKPLFIRRR